MTWREQPINGGLLRFDRVSGTNLLLRNAATAANRRIAPRALQIGLLTPCNLACSFCYRDTNAPSRLTADFLVDLLVQAQAWGVLEVAFGGGEPLLFKGFAEMLRRLRKQTHLGLNVTTNGTLLNERMVDELDGLIDEVRISAYPDNGYRTTLRRARKLSLGLNLLVTPKNLHQLEPLVYDALACGARNVLLLGYKGADAGMHLGPADMQLLARSVQRMAQLPLRLDICWHPHLSGVDHLFARSDCGAGDEFLVITPDRAVQACSFSHERKPFETFDELRAIYDDMQIRRPSALIGGCTRSEFADQQPALQIVPTTKAPPEPAAWVWQARASNNSGDWTIAARFCDAETARSVAQELRAVALAHTAFKASDEGEAFELANDYDGSVPTPPLLAYAKKHGFEWKEGLWWEEDSLPDNLLTVGAIGDAVIVYHDYCMGLDEDTFKALFRQVGALEMGHWQYGRPRVIIHAQGQNDAAIAAVRAYADEILEAEYASDVDTEPPWGREVQDPRLELGEGRRAGLTEGEHQIDVDGSNITLMLAFDNSFAGSLAVEHWLKQSGFTNIHMEVEPGLATLTEP